MPLIGGRDNLGGPVGQRRRDPGSRGADLELRLLAGIVMLAGMLLFVLATSMGWVRMPTRSLFSKPLLADSIDVRWQDYDPDLPNQLAGTSSSVCDALWMGRYNARRDEAADLERTGHDNAALIAWIEARMIDEECPRD